MRQVAGQLLDLAQYRELGSVRPVRLRPRHANAEPARAGRTLDRGPPRAEQRWLVPLAEQVAVDELRMSTSRVFGGARAGNGAGFVRFLRSDSRRSFGTPSRTSPGTTRCSSSQAAISTFYRPVRRKSKKPRRRQQGRQARRRGQAGRDKNSNRKRKPGGPPPSPRPRSGACRPARRRRQRCLRRTQPSPQQLQPKAEEAQGEPDPARYHGRPN